MTEELNQRLQGGATQALNDQDAELEYEGDEETSEVVGYRALHARSVDELNDQVNSLIEEGWDPHGSLAVLPDGSLIQPMIIVE